MGFKFQSKAKSPKTEFVRHEIFISRVTYPSIRNFMLSSKKYTLWSMKNNRYVYVMFYE
jgi:hypothetical protein